MKKSQSKTEKKSTSLKILRSPQKIVEPIKTNISVPKFAKSISELANIIGCSRKSLTRWRLSEDFPSLRSDGRFDVAEVKDWIAHNGKCLGSGRVVPIDISCDARRALIYGIERARNDAQNKNARIGTLPKKARTRVAGRREIYMR
mgnify:CR=1 FL=1